MGRRPAGPGSGGPFAGSSPSGEYYIGDGWHRFLAAKRQDRKAIKARVHQGGKRDAILHSLGANRSHGLRRTREDVRRSIRLAIVNLSHKNYSNNQVSKIVGCSDHTVASVRTALIASSQIAKIEDTKRTAVRGEKEYPIETSAIGRKPEPHPSQPASTLGHSHGAMANLTPIGEVGHRAWEGDEEDGGLRGQSP